MADWNRDAILTLARSFMESRLLLTGAELNLFTLLEKEALSAAQVCERIAGDLRGVTILLDALAGMELLSKEDGRYRCDAVVAALLSESSPETVQPMVLHAGNLWQRWSNLTVRVTPARPDTSPGGWLRSFIGAMHTIGAPQAGRIVDRINPALAGRLLDVGGASGTYTLAFLRAVPQLQATLFDRPEVVEIARVRLREEGLLSRVRLVAGDFYTDPLPGGHDLVFLSAIIHQNSPEQNEALFKKAFAALDPGGRLIVRDHILEPDRTRPTAGAIFAVNMLMGTAGGNCYTFEEIREGLERVGFTAIGLLQPDSRMDGLVEAHRP